MNDREIVRVNPSTQGVIEFSFKSLNSALSKINGDGSISVELDREFFMIAQGGVMATLVSDGTLKNEDEYAERHGSDIFRDIWKKGMPSISPSETYGQHAIFLMKTDGVGVGISFLVEEMKKRLPPSDHKH